MHQHSTGPFPSSDTVAVMWNLAFSLAAAFAFFWALSASHTPMVVGMPAITSRPIGMVGVFGQMGYRQGACACVNGFVSSEAVCRCRSYTTGNECSLRNNFVIYSGALGHRPWRLSAARPCTPGSTATKRPPRCGLHAMSFDCLFGLIGGLDCKWPKACSLFFAADSPRGQLPRMQDDVIPPGKFLPRDAMPARLRFPAETVVAVELCHPLRHLAYGVLG